MPNRENRIPIPTTVSQADSLKPPVVKAVTLSVVLPRRLVAQPNINTSGAPATGGVAETAAVF